MVVVLPVFFFALADDVVCAPPKDPAIRNALIQKLAANFKYFVMDILSKPSIDCSYPVQYTHPRASGRYNFRVRTCDPAAPVLQTMYSYLLRQI